MAGKKRSGLVNDRRAYGCGYYTPTPTPTPNPNPCGVINIANIATYDSENNWYTLNGNYTITACQILNIPVGTTLRIIGVKTLTNSGTINNIGSLLLPSGKIQNNGTIDNIGYIDNQFGSTFNNNTGGIINNNSQISNDGTFNNSGTIQNNTGGIFYNTDFFNNNTGGIVYNTGTIRNSDLTGGGRINNNAGGFIYTYGGGALYNDDWATINNNAGTISTADGSSTCGLGSFVDNGTFIDNGTSDTQCPP